MPEKAMSQNDKKQQIKTRNYMYQQQIEYLPEKLEKDLRKTLDNLEGIEMWAAITHTLDKKEGQDGYVAPHIHIMLRFKNPRSLKGVADELGDDPQHVRKWDKHYKSGFAYLIHATNGARHKYQYSAQEVLANFDYIGLIKKMSIEVEAHSTKAKIDRMLDGIAKGEISLKKAKALLSGSEFADAATALNRAHALFLERRAEQLYEEMTAKDEIVEIYWLFGSTGTGKTRLAVKLAEMEGEYYKSSTTKDPFQFYQGEYVVILDELRPETIPFSELLALFDPYSRGRIMMSSRYYNKMLSCKCFIVTTPYSPVDFYNKYRIHKEDRGDQLYRRLTAVIMLDMQQIYKMEYDQVTGLYRPIEVKENRYSQNESLRKTEKDLFRMI